MSKIGVIGPRGEVMTFLAAGFAVYEAEDTTEAAAALQKAAGECAILYLSPAYAAALEEEIAARSFCAADNVVHSPWHQDRHAAIASVSASSYGTGSA